MWYHLQETKTFSHSKYVPSGYDKASKPWLDVDGVGIFDLTYAACFVISIIRIIHVFHVRDWVLFSGWMKDQEQFGNPETNFASFGQVAALVTMAGFVIVGFDKLTWQAGDQG